MSSELEFRFSPDVREKLEDFGGEHNESIRYIGTEAQVEEFIKRTELWTGHFLRSEPFWLDMRVPKSELTRLIRAARKFAEAVEDLSPSSKAVISNVLGSLRGAGAFDSEWRPDEELEASAPSINPDDFGHVKDIALMILSKPTKAGRPRKSVELRFVRQMVREYRAIFGTAPPKSDRSGFAEVVAAAFASAGLTADLKSVITRAVRSGEKSA